MINKFLSSFISQILLITSINTNNCRRFKPCLSCHRKPTYGYDKLCPSWVYSPDSNIHITRDREWFEDDYMAFSSIVYHTRNKPWDNAMQQIEVGPCGPPFGRETKERSLFHPHVRHDIRAKWPADERHRFERYRSTRSPSVNIRQKPWSEEELPWLKNDGVNFDEMAERTKNSYDKELPAYAGNLKTRKIVTVLRGKHRTRWLKNPFQEHFDRHMGYCESEEMAAMQVKDIMSEAGLEVSSDEEWEDMDEDDTDEGMCECEDNKCECPNGID
ncbi:hypothetical protein FOZG_02006 [Fusarium oxysporum Fo47]|uniref:Uncharacterized protein n=1 Tax=Fusarium oxysporum Fo47 TaxID=660027 RepID=W9LB27_FUSOX|nr:hypothetical protein FOZG_02006 [Fusarium oxysporum Fo47]